MYVKINDRIGKAKFNLLPIILDSGESSYIVLGKYTHKLRKKKTKQVHWITQVGNFKENYMTNLEIIQKKMDAMKSVKCNFHMDDSQGNHSYDMILGRDFIQIKNILMFLRLHH